MVSKSEYVIFLTMSVVQKNISSIFSRNSEAYDASEFQENIEEKLPCHSDHE